MTLKSPILSNLLKIFQNQTNSGNSLQVAGDLCNSVVNQTIVNKKLLGFININFSFGSSPKGTNSLFTEPKLPLWYLPRNDYVRCLSEHLLANKIMFITGSTLSGKTTLSLLIKEYLSIPTQWVLFSKNTTPVESLQFFGVNYLSAEFDIFKNDRFMLDSFPQNSLIIFDNFPYKFENEHHILLINEFISKAVSSNCLMIINSIVPTIDPKLDINSAYHIQINSITEDEIGYALELENKLDFAQFIINITQGKPALVDKLFHYLKLNKWAIMNDQIFDSVVNSNYAQSLRQFLYKEFVESVTNPDARNLFYRLDLLFEVIDKDIIHAVSTIPTIIKDIDSIIETLKTNWLELDENHYRINYYLKGVGKLYIPATERIQIYQNRLQTILTGRDRKTIDCYKTNLICIYCMFTNDYKTLVNECFETTTSILIATNLNTSEIVSYLHFVSFWSAMEINIPLDNDEKAVFRLCQYILLERTNKPSNYIRADFIRLLDTQISLMSLMSIFSVVSKEGVFDLVISIKIVKLMVENETQVQPYTDKIMKLAPPDIIPSSIDGLSGIFNIVDILCNQIWLNSLYYDENEFDNLFCMSLELPIPVVTRLYNAHYFTKYVISIIDRIYLHFYNSSNKEAILGAYLTRFENAMKLASLSNNTHMKVAILKNRMILIGEDSKDINQVASIYSSANTSPEFKDSFSIYYLDSTYATQLYLQNNKPTDEYAYMLFDNALRFLPQNDDLLILDSYFVIKRMVHIITRSNFTDRISYMQSKVIELLTQTCIIEGYKIDTHHILAYIYKFQGKVNESIKELVYSFDYGLSIVDNHLTENDNTLKARIILATLFLKRVWLEEILNKNINEYDEEQQGTPLNFDFMWRTYPQLHLAYTTHYVLLSIGLIFSIYIDINDTDSILGWVQKFYNYALKHLAELDDENGEVYRIHKLFLKYLVHLSFPDDVIKQFENLYLSDSDLISEITLANSYLEPYCS